MDWQNASQHMEIKYNNYVSIAVLYNMRNINLQSKRWVLYFLTVDLQYDES